LEMCNKENKQGHVAVKEKYMCWVMARTIGTCRALKEGEQVGRVEWAVYTASLWEKCSL